MATNIRILPHYSYDVYLHWQGKWELIDGLPFALDSVSVPEHQAVAGNVSAAFRFALKSCKRCKVLQPVDYKIGEHTVYQPDALVVCKPIEKTFLDFPPVLIVEVLSPRTTFIDRHKKFHSYQEEGVPYYLIVSPETEETEVYALEEGEYVLKQKAVSFTYTFQLHEECEATIDFGEIWK